MAAWGFDGLTACCSLRMELPQSLLKSEQDFPLHTAHPDPIAAGMSSPHECNAPANKIRRYSFISNGFVRRADMPPSGNPFLSARRNKAPRYPKLGQGGLRWIWEGSGVKGTTTQVGTGPNTRKSQDRMHPDRTLERDINRALATANGCIWVKEGCAKGGR